MFSLCSAPFNATGLSFASIRECVPFHANEARKLVPKYRPLSCHPINALCMVDAWSCADGYAKASAQLDRMAFESARHERDAALRLERVAEILGS